MKKKGSLRMDRNYDYLQKIIIIGDSGVGKSNMLLRYSEGKFDENSMITIGLNYVFKTMVIDGVKIRLQIWDTAGQDKYKTITQNYYRNSNGVIITYGIDNRDSFYSVRNWIDDLTLTVKENIPIILVGNKSDLEEEREVSEEQASHYAESSGLPFMQCSAKSGESIIEVFETLGRMVKQKNIDAKLKEDDSVEPIKEGRTIKLMTISRNVQSRCCEK